MENDYATVHDYKDPSSENPDWTWQGTLEHIASLGLEPIAGTEKLVPAAELDETGFYRPERGTGQQ